MQTPGRFQTTSHPLSQIPLSWVEIVSKVYSFVAFSPKALYQLIAFSPKFAVAKWRKRQRSSVYSNRDHFEYAMAAPNVLLHLG